MSNYTHNNSNSRIVQMIQQLQEWNKKPSLNHKMSDFLDVFQECINKGEINFAEAGLFLQESSIFNGKQIDLLYKGFLETHKNLSDVYNDEQVKEVVNPNSLELTNVKAKKERKKHELSKEEEKVKNVSTDAQVVENNPSELINDLNIMGPPVPDKFSIPGIPDEILEKLKLSDCLPGGPIDEFIDKLDSSHPLYSIISKLGKEISQNKDIFTYNNLSLSGMSWNALLKIEEVLTRINRKDDDLDQNDNKVSNAYKGTQTDDDSGIDTDHFNGDLNAPSCSNVTSRNSGIIDLDTSGNSGNVVPCLGNSENQESLLSSNSQEESTDKDDQETLPLVGEVDSSARSGEQDISQSTEEVVSTPGEENISCPGEEDISGSGEENTTPSCEKNVSASGEEDVLRSGEEDNQTQDIAPESEEPDSQLSELDKIDNNDSLDSGGKDNEEQNTKVSRKLSQISNQALKDQSLQNIVKINLLKLDLKLLSKKQIFHLPVEYLGEKPPNIKKRKVDETTTEPVKRKKIEAKPKTFDLELFENFCYDFYESQGIVAPRAQPISSVRKSVDNRSEVSYGYPLTPADSGRFSITFATDSDFEHCEIDNDHCRESSHPFSRADSGIEGMEPFSPSGYDHHDDPEPENVERQNDTLNTLKKLFPTTFSDPDRAEALKNLYKQPEDDEDYLRWKNFINEKTANEQEFNIHEYGTNILNHFSPESTDQLNFETIVKDKSAAEISRYFVSTLQLANTYNIEIVDKFPGEVRADSMQLKFLSNTRAHEEIDTHFNDMSEDHFMDNLKSNRSKNVHSTPVQPPAVPKQDSSYKASKRKRLEYCD